MRRVEQGERAQRVGSQQALIAAQKSYPSRIFKRGKAKMSIEKKKKNNNFQIRPNLRSQ
jgi:hypothetical protein